ncbi:MAG: hypothetical protein IJ192_14905 [Clostridia bacterium]|nr:hypothetical protein [Clostridia bacterium]
MIRIVTNSDIHIDKRKERIDMCQALEEMKADARAEGIALGKAEGEVKGFLKALASLVKDGILTLSDAAKRANMTVDEFESQSGLKA